jgi:hypothetical protein
VDILSTKATFRSTFPGEAASELPFFDHDLAIDEDEPHPFMMD